MAPLIPENLRQRVWTPALAAAGVRHVRIHSLRHFYASVLIANGENSKYVSSQLGHASVQITVDRYGHLFPDVRRAAAGRFEERLASSQLPADQTGTPENTPTSVEIGGGEAPKKTRDEEQALTRRSTLDTSASGVLPDDRPGPQQELDEQRPRKTRVFRGLRRGQIFRRQ